MTALGTFLLAAIPIFAVRAGIFWLMSRTVVSGRPWDEIAMFIGAPDHMGNYGQFIENEGEEEEMSEETRLRRAA